MKRHIQSALCSALIVPGLGQVFNNRILKGLILMALVFILLVAITLDIAILIISRIPYMQVEDIESIGKIMIKAFQDGDLSTLWALLAVSVILWIYSIIDAFMDGLRIERTKKGSG